MLIGVAAERAFLKPPVGTVYPPRPSVVTTRGNAPWAGDCGWAIARILQAHLPAPRFLLNEIREAFTISSYPFLFRLLNFSSCTVDNNM